MNYDEMSVHELVTEIAKDATHEVACLMSADMSYENHRAELESAIRKAVTREASVGTIEICEHVADDVAVLDSLPFGFYSIIPKEVP